jgi:hypothetical protein
MASGLGELFIELGTVGDSKELAKFVAKVKEGAEAIEKQMKLQNKASDDNTKGIKRNESGLGGLINKIGKYKIAIGIAIGFLNKFTNELVKSNQEMLALTRMSDIALSTFNKWDSIGKMFGVEGIGGQLEGLNERLFELRLTGQGARGFQLAGINPTGQDAEGVLEQLRTRIQGMDNTTASYILQQMGLSPKMITLLRMGRSEFEELWATVKRYQLTEKQRLEIEKMNVQLQIVFMKLRYLKDRAVLAIMPVWVRFMQSIERVTRFFVRLGQLIGKVVKYVADLRIGTVKLSTAVSTVLIPALVALALYFKPIETVLMAIYLIIDDIMTFVDGGDSVIGHILNAITEIEQRINFDSPKWVKDLLLIMQNIDVLASPFENFRNMKENPQVSAGKLAQNVVKSPLAWAINPMLMPAGLYMRQKEFGEKHLLPLFNKGSQTAINFGNSARSLFGMQNVNNENKTQSINMDVDIFTNTPMNALSEEIARAQFMFGM